MKTYDEFVGVTPTPRKGIIHLHNMNDVEFVRLFRSVATEMNGLLDSIPCSLKVDGGSLRLGKDSAGRKFVEGNRTGPRYDPEDFTNYVKSRGLDSGRILIRAGHYTNMARTLMNSHIFDFIPNDCKVTFEVMYNPMGEVVDKGIKFINITYDRDKLGSIMTLIPLNVLYASTGTEHMNKASILHGVLNSSTDEIKVVNPTLFVHDLDISGVIDPIMSLNDEAIRVLQSRKHADKPLKDSYRELIAKVKKELTDLLLSSPEIYGKFRLGESYEGLVFDFGSHRIKVVTEEYRNGRL